MSPVCAPKSAGRRGRPSNPVPIGRQGERAREDGERSLEAEGDRRRPLHAGGSAGRRSRARGSTSTATSPRQQRRPDLRHRRVPRGPRGAKSESSSPRRVRCALGRRRRWTVGRGSCAAGASSGSCSSCVRPRRPSSPSASSSSSHDERRAHPTRRARGRAGRSAAPTIGTAAIAKFAQERAGSSDRRRDPSTSAPASSCANADEPGVGPPRTATTGRRAAPAPRSGPVPLAALPDEVARCRASIATRSPAVVATSTVVTGDDRPAAWTTVSFEREIPHPGAGRRHRAGRADHSGVDGVHGVARGRRRPPCGDERALSRARQRSVPAREVDRAHGSVGEPDVDEVVARRPGRRSAGRLARRTATPGCRRTSSSATTAGAVRASPCTVATTRSSAAASGVLSVPPTVPRPGHLAGARGRPRRPSRRCRPRRRDLAHHGHAGLAEPHRAGRVPQRLLGAQIERRARAESTGVAVGTGRATPLGDADRARRWWASALGARASSAKPSVYTTTVRPFTDAATRRGPAGRSPGPRRSLTRRSSMSKPRTLERADGDGRRRRRSTGAERPYRSPGARPRDRGRPPLGKAGRGAERSTARMGGAALELGPPVGRRVTCAEAGSRERDERRSQRSERDASARSREAAGGRDGEVARTVSKAAPS